jgi:putative transposase
MNWALEECLNANWFVTLADARRKIEAWRRDYNEERPHSSSGYLAPQHFAQVVCAGASNDQRLLHY